MKNETFNKLPAKERRILIAKDVVKQIKLGIYNPKKMIYAKVESDVISQESLLKNPLCEVCALGALLLSTIRLANKYTFDNFIGKWECNEVLKKYFNKNQIQELEFAFEMWEANGGTLKKAVEFGEQYQKPSERLVAIFENVIKNDGEFIP